MLDLDQVGPYDGKGMLYDSVLVRELALFAYNDETLYQKYYEDIYKKTVEAYRKARFSWNETFRLYYNTIPQITMRYQAEFDWIGKRMTLLERCKLAKEIMGCFLEDILLEGVIPDEKDCDNDRPGNEACIGKMLDSGQYSLFA